MDRLQTYPDHPSTTLPLKSNGVVPTIKLTLKTEPVLYKIDYKDQVQMRDRAKVYSIYCYSNNNYFLLTV